MRFNSHFNLTGSHAFLSASKYHWINYDDEKMDTTYRTARAAMRGSQLHELAKEAIRLGVKFRGNDTIAAYVNDAIGYRMTPEQILFYSDNAYGTADAISFRRNKLRIHDLKTGETRVSEHQLEVYMAFFCLEYGFKPTQIEAELRLYHMNEVKIFIPDPDDITHIMDKIVTFDNRINLIRAEELG